MQPTHAHQPNAVSVRVSAAYSLLSCVVAGQVGPISSLPGAGVGSGNGSEVVWMKPLYKLDDGELSQGMGS